MDTAQKPDAGSISITDNEQINEPTNHVVTSVRNLTENQPEQIRRLIQIGTALSAERNIDRLLELIVDEARNFTGADGGTLYIVDDDEKTLHLAIVQNNSLNVRMGGSAGKITWPPVKLFNDDNGPNHANVSSYSVLSGKVVNISDVYNAEDFDFEGTRKYDDSTGYRSQSMLVVPLRNHENDIIGVLQLLNARENSTGSVIPFSKNSQKLTESLASQAAVALTNNLLIRDLEILLESFIKSIATAIDEKSHYTGNHGRRVVELTMSIAQKINEAKEGPFKELYFDEDEINELRIAAWLHDVGKIAVPEHVMDKSTKLETIYDRIDLLKTRFEVIKRDMEIEHLTGGMTGPARPDADIEQDFCENELKSLRKDIDFLESINRGSEFMSDEKIERVKKIASRKWNINEKNQPLLTEDEVSNLCVRRGTITDEERATINSHAALTHEILSQLPFPKKLRNVPRFAASHHEYINGKGYPGGLRGEDIPIQARIMALADVFEALTAKDRPYREGNTLSGAIKILGLMVKDNNLDKDIFELFLKEKIYLEYAKKEMDPTHIDEIKL